MSVQVLMSAGIMIRFLSKVMKYVLQEKSMVDHG
jgi:hypothetical protein